MRSLAITIGGLCLASTSIAQTKPADLTRYRQAETDRVKFDTKFTPADLDKLRLLNHFRYRQASLNSLVTLDKTLSAGSRSCDMMPRPADAVIKLIQAADQFAISKGSDLRLRAGSCFRSIDEQVAIFCSARDDKKEKCFEPVARALTSAPSGFSEHATGYTLDFFVRRVVGANEVDPGLCEINDSEPCKGQLDGSPFGQWLKDKAPAAGFELSFPCAGKEATDPIRGRTICLSSQGVMYEPWHWRWVGASATVPGAAEARAIFAAARACFAANPAVSGAVATCDKATERR